MTVCLKTLSLYSKPVWLFARKWLGIFELKLRPHIVLKWHISYFKIYFSSETCIYLCCWLELPCRQFPSLASSPGSTVVDCQGSWFKPCSVQGYLGFRQGKVPNRAIGGQGCSCHCFQPHRMSRNILLGQGSLFCKHWAHVSCWLSLLRKEVIPAMSSSVV